PRRVITDEPRRVITDEPNYKATGYSFPLLTFDHYSKQYVSIFETTTGRTQMQRQDLKTRTLAATKDLQLSGNFFMSQLLPNNRLVVSTAKDATVTDLQSPELPIQTISDIAPSAWSSNFNISPLRWSSNAHFLLGGGYHPSNSPNSITFIRRFDPKTLKPSGIAVLTGQTLDGTVQPASGGMFSPDNKFLYVISGNGKLLAWRLDQLKWSRM
ncbi:MAG TPA: hypothetical protein VM821_04910, partial [Abditibacteriaceae bacterium]|nr:hypothetical protein [Abditibacteriaceae bacterium]